MIRARPHPENARLAIVEATTLDELQEATGAHVHIQLDDPEWPFSAVVRADVVPRLPAKAAFVKRVTAGLPGQVPLTLRRRLAGQAFDLTSIPGRPDADSKSALAKEARAIAAAAKKLTDQVDRWHARAGPIALDTSAAQEELAGPLFSDGGRLTEDELKLATAGTGRLALRLVLLGLQVHVGSVAGRLSRPGSPRDGKSRALEELVIAAFDAQSARAGKPRRKSAKQPGDWWARAVLLEVLAKLKDATGDPDDNAPRDMEKRLKLTRKAMRRTGP